MAKRKASYELNSLYKKISDQQSPAKIYPNLHSIVNDIKREKNHSSILKKIKQYVQTYNQINEYSLQTLLLRFLRELKSAFESIPKYDSDVVTDENVIFINNLRLITQTMQEMSIDKTMMITDKHKFFKILNSDEYSNYVFKNRTSYGTVIEFSAMKIMEIADSKLIDIQNQHNLDDIYMELYKISKSPLKTPIVNSKSSSKSPNRQQSQRSQQSAGYKNEKMKYYKYKTKVINSTSKNIYKRKGESKQYVKDNHKFYTIADYRNMVSAKIKKG